MRSLALAIAILGLGCSFGAFEDLRDQSPVDSNGQPDTVSSEDFGVAVIGVPGVPGMRFVAAGNNPLSLSTFVYLPVDGEVLATGIDVPGLGDDANLDRPPALAAAVDDEDDSGLVFMGGLDEVNSILVFNAGDGRGQVALLDTIDASACGGPADIENIGFSMAYANTDVGDVEIPDLVMLAETTFGHSELLVFEDYQPDEPLNCFRCALRTGADEGLVGHALAAIDLDGVDDDQIVMTLLVQPAGPTGFEVFNVSDAFLGADPRCFSEVGNQPLISSLDPNDPEREFGLHIAVGDFNGNDTEDIAFSRSLAPRVRVQIDPSADGGTADPGVRVDIPLPPGMVGDLQLAAGDVSAANGEDDEVLVGAPARAVEGEQSAGAVVIFSLAFGGAPSIPPLFVSDSSPEENQRFGRALAIAKFQRMSENDDITIAGASGEVFSVFAATSSIQDPRDPP